MTDLINSLTLLGFTKGIISEIIRFNNKVKITPNSLDIHGSSEWNTVKSILVNNRTDNPIFDIYIILFSPEGKESKFNLKFKSFDDSFEQKFLDMSINTQFISFDSDANGKKFKILKIARIMPKSFVEFDISSKEKMSLKIEAIRFSKTPVESISVDPARQISFSFTPPYNIKIMNASLIMKRNLYK